MASHSLVCGGSARTQPARGALTVWVWLFFLLLFLILWACQGWLRTQGVPVGRAATIATAMLMQALPFLALGVLVSEAIEAWLSPALIARFFPTNPLLAHLLALAVGAIIPVCDCSAVPIFRSLVAKGVPLPAATTLMLASPAINPLVVLSTWYAFGSWTVVGGRIAISAVVALIVGVSMMVRPPALGALRDGGADACGSDSCSHSSHEASLGGVLASSGVALARIVPYLLGAVVASTCAQVFFPLSTWLSGASEPVALVVMMAAGFALSLCSSSDALIARSLAGVAPMGALMGFMVFGPMVDIKNVALLSSRFPISFVVRIGVSVAIVSSVGVWLTWGWWA